MPLDGQTGLRDQARLYRGKQATARRAADMLGLIRRRFVTYEWRWIQHETADKDNGFCLIGGVLQAGFERRTPVDRAMSYLARTITGGKRRRRSPTATDIIAGYNDTHSFVDVMEILAGAKILAEADAS